MNVGRRCRSWPMLFATRAIRSNTIATDLELQISAKVQVPEAGDQSTTVAARKLQDLLRALPESSEVN